MRFHQLARAPRSTPQQRADWLSQWTASGLSARAFAGQHGLSPATLAQWKWKAARSARVAPTVFHTIELPPSAPESPWDVEADFASGVRLRARSHCPAVWLQQLISGLT